MHRESAIEDSCEEVVLSGLIKESKIELRCSVFGQPEAC